MTELKDQHGKFKFLLENEFIPKLHEQVERQILFLQKGTAFQTSLIKKATAIKEPVEALAKIAQYKGDILKLVESHFDVPEDLIHDQEFASFNSACHQYLDTLDELVTCPQHRLHFESQPGDKIYIKAGKAGKRILYGISVFPARFINFFKKSFNKPEKALRPWNRHIHLRHLTTFHLNERLNIELLSLFDVVYRNIIQSTKTCWQTDEDITKAFDDFINNGTAIGSIAPSYKEKAGAEMAKLQALRQELTDQALVIYEAVFAQYTDAYSKAGTIELSNTKWSPSRINKKHAELNHKYKQLTSGWNNTLLTLSDDWEVDLELYLVVYLSFIEYHKAIAKVNERVQDVVFDRLDGIKDVLEVSRTHIEVEVKKAGDLKSLLEKELEFLRETLTPEVLPATVDMIMAQDFPALINNLESEIDKLIQSVSTRRTLIKGMAYDQPVKISTLNFISPYELINFESWPHLESAIKNIKMSVTSHLNELQIDIMDIGQIAEFNLESALSLFEGDDKTNDPGTIAVEGMDRAMERVENLRNDLTVLTTAVAEDMLAALVKFNGRLIKFTNNENLYDIRVRIARGKALDRSKRIKEQVVYIVKNLLPSIITFFRSGYGRGLSFFNGTLKKFGIAGYQEAISSELADFLSETERSVEKLPFVYQRLFAAEPLKEVNFFEGRTQELHKLNNAYNNWMVGRFASVVVVGEKGGGITTLFNFFLNDLGTSSSVHRFSPDTPVESAEEFLQFFSVRYDEKFKSFEHLVDYLNSCKKVVVLENIQKMYLKRVNGFAALKLLTELMSLTSKHVFWVMGATKYAWNYLDKTMELSDYFSYVIPLEEFDSATMINVINKRHRVSGYNIEYEPAASDLNYKKFKRLSEDEQQDVLRERYFDSLNSIAKSNVSLALIYWLRSTSEIVGNTIKISSMQGIDFSFMKGLSDSKAYTLAELLLHDWLTEDDYCKLKDYTPGKVRSILQPLYEDGIIIKNNNHYLINPLMYRQTVMMLKSRNIIH